MKKELLYLSLLGAAAINPGSILANKKATEAEKPNVLFLIVDDLRPQLGCYGNTTVQTPNIDAFAKAGVTFESNFCNYPVCGPSRASFMSGMRPHKNFLVNNHCTVEKDFPNYESLPGTFKNNGYHTVSLGKVLHHRLDCLEDWSERPWGPGDGDKNKAITGWRNYLSKENIELCKKHGKVGKAWEIGDVADEDYYDGKTASKAIEKLKQFKKDGEPFFMAVGFTKPHLPFTAPKKYFDLYPLDNIQLAKNPNMAENAPQSAFTNWPELRKYVGMPKKGLMPDSLAKKLIRGYCASATYSDALVGKVLKTLKELDLDENTIVVLIGDHGWLLGEHSLWAKHSNFKLAMNTPMIVKAPGFKANKKVEELTELVDVYPSLCELSGLDTPKYLEGKSFVPLLENPSKNGKKIVYCKMGNGWSAISQRYIYTEWLDKNNQVKDRMLFDHKTDPEENLNVVDSPEMKKVVNEMKQLLNEYIQAH